MKVRNTLILLGILVLLGGYVLLFERGPAEEQTSVTDETLRPAILAFDAASVRRVHISRPSSSTETLLEYDEGDGIWYVTIPRREPADQSRVSQFVGDLAGLQSVRELSGALEEPASYGLEPADIQITITLADGTTYHLDLGAPTVTGGGYYARVGDQQEVYIVPSYVALDADEFITSPPYQPTPTPEPTTPAISPEPSS